MDENEIVFPNMDLAAQPDFLEKRKQRQAEKREERLRAKAAAEAAAEAGNETGPRKRPAGDKNTDSGEVAKQTRL